MKKRKLVVPRRTKPAEASTSASKPNGRSKLEETLEFTNLTEFRNSLLNFIPRIQDNEYLRFVLTKHGKPVAVVLSYDAYNLLKRVAERVMAEDDAKEPAVAEREVYQELIGDLPTGPVPIDVSTGRDITEAEMRKGQRLVHMAVQEYIKAMKSGAKGVKEEEEILPGESQKL